MSVRKALVLAAGFGKRLRPFTCVTPKPLLPVWGEPMLARVVSLLRERGVDDIVVNAHYLHEQVEAWVDACRSAAHDAGEKLQIKVSYEPEILGSGGALNPVREWIGKEPFYLVNSDIVMEDAPDLIRPFEASSARDVIGVAAVTEAGPRTIEVEPSMSFVTNWGSTDAGVDGTYTYSGFALLRPEILEYVEAGFSSIVAAYEKAMMAGRFVKAVRSDGFLWEDAGTIQRYVDLNRDGEENAFAEFPQLKALGVKNPKFMSARGSERVFFRADEGVVVLYDDATRTENGLYAAQDRWLKAKGVSVPTVLADRPDMKAMVISDAGCEKKMTLEEDVKVIEALVKFNALGSAADLPVLTKPFDAETWAWERNLFAKYCLGINFQMALPEAARKELENVAAILEREPKALVHRDFQSTNVLWKNGELTFIDFQGMRLGPAAYDVAAFVYDPYVTFTEGERRALVALYAKQSGRAEFAKIVPYAAVQRLSQCLGAYGRLASVGQPQFMRYVLPALVNLLDAADRAGLDAVGALAEDLIAKVEHAHHHHDEHDGHTCSCGHHH